MSKLWPNATDVREAFRTLRKNNPKAKYLSMKGLSFLADSRALFGEPNWDYIDAEIAWYESESLNVNDLAEIYGKRVKIWDQVADRDGYINSNYGWCIYSHANGDQYYNVLRELIRNPDSRRGTMIYTRPQMQENFKNHKGMEDFMCTNAVNYSISGPTLRAVVQMRSNDAVFGYNNDIAWQTHVINKLKDDYNHRQELCDRYRQMVHTTEIIWQPADMHVYERHLHLLD